MSVDNSIRKPNIIPHIRYTYEIRMAFSFAKFLPRGSVVLATTTFGSYALGLLRDRLLARTFGAAGSLDSYNAAFLIPDFMFNLLVASGIAAAAVPLFTELYQRSRKHAYEYMNSLLLAAIGIMAIVGVGMAVFAPTLSYLVAPGLSDEAHIYVARMMRIIALSPILFAASNALGAMLVAQKRFLFYGLSPIAYNIGIIFGVFSLTPSYGIMGVAYGTVIGAALHLGVRLIDAIHSGWRWQLVWHFWHTPEIRRTVRLMLPKMIGHPVELVTFWIFTGLASLLAPGSITVLNFARNFQSVPVSLIGIAMATAVFPVLSQAALSSPKKLQATLRRTATTIVLASSVAAIMLYAIRTPLITLLLGGGAFDADAIARTALVLGVFCLAIPTESVSHLLARAFYATKDTITPVAFSIVSLIVAGGTAYGLLGSLGMIGLPLAFFIISLVKTAGLWIFLSRKIAKA